jgi:hypothetical protein
MKWHIVVMCMMTLVGVVYAPLAAADAATAPAPAPTGTTTDWRALPPNELAELTRSLVGDDEAVRLARQRLAEHITTKYLADPAATKSVSSGDWICFADRLGKDLSDANRGLWAEKLFSTYGADATTLSGLQATAITDLAKTLQSLGAAAQGATLVEQSISARAWKADELATVAKTLSGFQDAGKTARLALAKYISDKYLADPAVVRSVAPGTWKTLTDSLRMDLAAETQAEWSGKLRSAFVDDAAALGTLKLGDAKLLAAALEALGDKQALGVVPTWMTGTTAGQSLKPTELASLAGFLARNGDEGKAARQRFAEYITTKYLADAASTKSISCKDWCEIARRLAVDLTEEGRKTWAEKILSAYTGAGGSVASLKITEVTDLVEAARRLGALDQGASLVQQSLASVAWKPGELVLLAGVLSGRDDAGKSARSQLAKQLADRYLASPGAARSVTCRQWSSLVDGLRRDLSRATRALWASKLREAFDANTLATLKFDEALDLGNALRGLGAPSAYDVLLPGLAKSTEWLSLDPPRLADLAGKLAGLGYQAEEPQSILARHVVATFLSSREKAKSISLKSWRGLTRVGKCLPDEARQAWAKGLKDAFVPDDNALLQMPAGDVTALAGALKPLDKKLADDLTYTWYTGRETGGGLKWGKDLIAAAQMAVSGGRRTQADRDAIVALLEKALASATIKPEEQFDTASQMMRLWLGAGNVKKAEEWAMKAYGIALGTEAARDSVSMNQLDRVATTIHSFAKGKAFPAFAAALARHARQGTLEVVHLGCVGEVLCTPEARQVLRDELLDSQGSPRLAVVKVLTEAYKKSGESVQWCKALDQGLTEAGGGDVKAAWLLARACTESVLFSSPNPLYGQKWLEEVLTTAESPSLRLQALEELVRGYAGIGKYEEALKRLDRYGGQFSGTELAQRIPQLRQQVQESQMESAADVQAAKARAAALHRLELKRRLDGARARNDAETAARYERMLNAEP